MKKEIKYIGYFDFQDSQVKRNYVASATNKMESICEVLNDCGFDVRIVSYSPVTEARFKFYKGHTINRRSNLSLKLFTSWGGTWRPMKSLRTLWHLSAAFVYLLFNLKRDDIVLVYHSLGYFNTILWVKKLKKFKMVLEVEELYLDVVDAKHKTQRKMEQKMIEAADAYIFPTELLDAKLNHGKKPSAIIYGTYKVEPQRVAKFDDGKIHVVYAGTFDPRKGGATAAAAAEFLPENYHVHICGFGTEKDTEMLIKQIEEIASKTKADITFDGLKLGSEYIEFIQKCHIGLSTQDPTATFNATSFPSKILSYIANGLSVVSIDIPAISGAKIGKYLTYYKKQEPNQIAAAIMKAPVDNDKREFIVSLGAEFKKNIVSLFNFLK